VGDADDSGGPLLATTREPLHVAGERTVRQLGQHRGDLSPLLRHLSARVEELELDVHHQRRHRPQTGTSNPIS
jgi:hypothetical protein